MSETNPDRVDESLIALRRILRATEQYERDLATAAGLSPAQLRVLQIIAGKPQMTSTPKALAQQMGVTQATVTALVDKLVARGFVQAVLVLRAADTVGNGSSTDKRDPDSHGAVRA